LLTKKCDITIDSSYPRFHELASSKQRFQESLKQVQAGSLFAANLESLLDQLIIQLNLDDYMETLSMLRNTLDHIDGYVSNDHILRSSIQQWRTLHGSWRKAISGDASSMIHLKDILKRRKALRELSSSMTGDSDDQTSRVLQSDQELQLQLIATELETFELQLKNTLERWLSTFNIIIGTMSILESQKGIAQAESVKQLTNLAFFFIPLTLSASLFGMNIVVSIYNSQTALDYINSDTLTGMGGANTLSNLDCHIHRDDNTDVLGFV
jgi:Mg2+ and Co2+ transporter CorA